MYVSSMSPQGCYPDKAQKVDEVLFLLSDSIRREVIYYFETKEDNQTVSRQTLCRHLDQRVPIRTRTQIQVCLDQMHLPKLDEAGWLEYNRDTGRITYQGHPDAERLLGDVQEMFTDQ